MEMVLFLLGLYLLLIAPVQVGLMAEWGPGRNAAHVGVMVWGIRKVFHFPLKRNEEGLLYLETPFPRGRHRRKKEKKKDWLSLVIRLLHLRKEKHAFVRLRLLKVQAYVSLPDAAQTAVMCGFLSLLLGALFPHGQSRFIPAYHGRNLGRAACIAEGRLGTIGLVYLMWKSNQKRRKQHGTSHLHPDADHPGKYPGHGGCEHSDRRCHLYGSRDHGDPFFQGIVRLCHRRR